MDEATINALIDNEKEWRRHIVMKMEESAKNEARVWAELHSMKGWNLVFRLAGTTVFAVILALLQRG